MVHSTISWYFTFKCQRNDILTELGCNSSWRTCSPPSGTITAKFTQTTVTLYASLSYSVSSPNVTLKASLNSGLNAAITVNGEFTCCPIENGQPNYGNQRTENFSITIPANNGSASLTYYLSGSPAAIQMIKEPHITSVSPSSGVADGRNFIIKFY